MVASHLLRGIGLSSKMVPTLTENCRFSCLLLHSQMRRVERNRTSTLPQVGQATPSGQRSLTMKSRQTSGLEKYSIASIRVVGSLISMLLLITLSNYLKTLNRHQRRYQIRAHASCNSAR